MSECTGDSDEAAKELRVAFNENKTMWLGNMFSCFGSMMSVLGGPSYRQNEEEPWELNFDSIHELSFLGSGAQGIVFGGRLHGEMVAVKKVREKCETDVRHLSKLNHENIVRFRGICTALPYYCLVMDFCQYGSLFDFLHNGSNLLPAQLMKWAKEIARGVDYLHENKIIHRDLKSPNVLIADNLVVKVSDFGTSRLWDNVSTTMSFTGTVPWMAPEVIRHEPCSEKVDVWSFGVVLWELLTRETPFKTMETHAVMWGVGTDTLSLPIPAGISASLKVLMCECWQRKARNRPRFKAIIGYLDLATPDFVAIDPENFAARQRTWAAEVQEGMERIYAKNNKTVSCSDPSPGQEAAAAPPRESTRQVKEAYERQINRANELFMEVCAVRLQLEQRERALAEREKQLKACRCGQRKNFTIKRQQSTTSSDGKPVTEKQPRKKRPESQMLVNYVDRDEGFTYTVAVDGCVCVDESVLNNNVDAKKDTILQKNGNIQTVAIHKPKARIEKKYSPIAQV